MYIVRDLLLLPLPLPGVEGRPVLCVATLLPVVKLVTNLRKGTEVLCRTGLCREVLYRGVLRKEVIVYSSVVWRSVV